MIEGTPTREHRYNTNRMAGNSPGLLQYSPAKGDAFRASRTARRLLRTGNASPFLSPQNKPSTALLRMCNASPFPLHSSLRLYLLSTITVLGKLGTSTVYRNLHLFTLGELPSFGTYCHGRTSGRRCRSLSHCAHTRRGCKHPLRKSIYQQP